MLFIIGADARAFEAYALHPGTRAAGMAGVFSAQADDSSAIWYNPAGLKRPGMIKQDYSLEWGTRPQRGTAGALDSMSGVKFVGAYVDHLFRWNALGFGMSYLSPYILAFDVKEPVSVLGAQTYGRVTSTYRQLSALFSFSVRESLSMGGTLDYLWTDVDCAYARCVDFGPMGLGASVGALYDALRLGESQIKIALLWRSPARLGYSSAPASGIGALLGDYLPDRPQSFTLGANTKISTRYGVVNMNVDLARVAWAAAAGSRAPASDYNKAGLSVEFLLPLGTARSVALRAGLAQAAASGEASPDARSLALGAGYAFAQHHVVDVSLESRALDSGEDRSYFSLSYSYQN